MLTQISFRIPEKDMDFLRWYAEQSRESMSSLYRNNTLDQFRQWKIDILSQLYAQGKLGFKRFCNIANISFHEGLLIIEKKDIEPPIAKAVDDYTSLITDELIKKIDRE